MSKTNIFENKDRDMPSWDERPARTSLDMSDTHKKTPPPGYCKEIGRDVDNIRRPRRGHDI